VILKFDQRCHYKIAHGYHWVNAGAFQPLTSRSNAEAKALLAKTVSALKPDKAKTLDEIMKGESGFLDRDYPPRFNLSDGKNIAVASPRCQDYEGPSRQGVRPRTLRSGAEARR
jgi:hypothetical protein